MKLVMCLLCTEIMSGSSELGWLDHLCVGTVHSAPYRLSCDIINVIPLRSVNDTQFSDSGVFKVPITLLLVLLLYKLHFI